MALLLSEAEVTMLLPMTLALEAVEEAFRWQGEQKLTNKPRVRLSVPGGLLHVMPAALPEARVMGLKSYATVRGGAKFVVLLFSAETGALLAVHRKIHLFGAGDAQRFTPGTDPPARFDWRGWRLGLLICYDVEFPEAVRLLALQGADAVLVPTANMPAFDEVQQLLVPARACENQLYVAYANACGVEAGLAYGGLSTVAGPRGKVLALDRRDAALVVVTLPPLPQDGEGQLPGRRPELYAGLTAVSRR